ncbi:GNAT family N-acetyltransferase [Specibacter cremeus]|uniref:GNAT family N-acetyltransferase n=1 Tax=Specibacter cremeus TaxID=1629051 RepID=UPI0030B81322
MLAHEDSDALRALVARDPVANVFMEALLAQSPSAVPRVAGAYVLGFFDDDDVLASACWVGSNVVPIEACPDHAVLFGRWIAANWRSHASIFGPREAVLAIFDALGDANIAAHEVRANQPLLAMDRTPTVAANPLLGVSRSRQFTQILTAAAAMFEEEVGYSPYLGGEESYRRRVAGLIQQGHSLSHCDVDGKVIFKADLGAVSRRATQIQGVWLDPAFRGLGLSAGYMAAVVGFSRLRAPIASLYVNDYNVRARALYERVGFEQVGTFATVLL